MSATTRVHASLDVPSVLSPEVVDAAVAIVAARIRWTLNCQLRQQVCSQQQRDYLVIRARGDAIRASMARTAAAQ
jgi:hypothetical protein